jgi:pyrroline-5-carboxylate reductase
MKNLKLGFIGAGNMAGCLIKGLLADGYAANNIWASTPNTAQLTQLQNLNIHTNQDNREIVKDLQVVVLTVKPQLVKKVVLEISGIIREKKPLVISIAAGINLKTLQSYLEDKTLSLIRCMPNTPTLLGCGATGLFANENCSTAQKNTAESLFRSVGITVWLNAEKQLNAVTALSGSGPAYFFSLIHALQRAAIELGFTAETAGLLIQQTALGAARMAMESNLPINELKQHVISPGGTTERALEVLDKGHFYEVVQEAVIAAKQRAEELTMQFQMET